MSLHIMYDHQCSKCEAFYIPYKKGIVCPNCGLNEKEVYDIIPRLINSAKYQIDCFGCYTPIAWWTGSFGDHVALLIFQVLDAFNTQEEKSFQEFALEYFDKSKWGNQLYMKNHICSLAIEVYEQLQTKSEE